MTLLCDIYLQNFKALLYNTIDSLFIYLTP